MNDLWSIQAAFNRGSEGQWEGFAGHREAVSGLLGAGAGRLCVLGAGNCNDLDLAPLVRAYREVWLVDLDGDALGRGVARQGLSGESRPNLLGGVDLTGALDLMAGWGRSTRIKSDSLKALEDWPAGRVAAALPGPFETVASTCVMSQIIGNARNSVGEAHPRFREVVRSIRLGHLRLLAALTAPGGEAVLVTDATSSDLEPDILSRPTADPAALLERAVREGRVFHGAVPEAILDAFRGDPEIAPRLQALRAVPPWRWRLHDRVYLAWAVAARFKGPSALSKRPPIH